MFTLQSFPQRVVFEFYLKNFTFKAHYNNRTNIKTLEMWLLNFLFVFININGIVVVEFITLRYHKTLA